MKLKVPSPKGRISPYPLYNESKLDCPSTTAPNGVFEKENENK
jgi:hypothetical protein